MAKFQHATLAWAGTLIAAGLCVILPARAQQRTPTTTVPAANVTYPGQVTSAVSSNAPGINRAQLNSGGQIGAYLPGRSEASAGDPAIYSRYQGFSYRDTFTSKVKPYQGVLELFTSDDGSFTHRLLTFLWDSFLGPTVRQVVNLTLGRFSGGTGLLEHLQAQGTTGLQSIVSTPVQCKGNCDPFAALRQRRQSLPQILPETASPGLSQ